jgi:ABC-2 type transport system permease protein
LVPAIRSEFRKIATIRSPALLLAAATLIVLAGVSGLVETTRQTPGLELQASALAHVGLAAPLSLILGILGTAGEYRYGTITDTFLSFPGRSRVLGAKLGVYALAGAAIGISAAAVALGAAAAWWAAKGGTFHLWTASNWRVIGGGVGANLALAAVGAALGALIRNVVGAIVLALAWIAAIEGIAAQLIGSGLARWLPFTASEALDQTNISAPGSLLPQWGGGLVLLGYAAVFAAAATLVTLGRDVT